MRYSDTLKMAALVVALGWATVGCDSDEFENAPRAQASASSAAQGQAAEGRQGGVGPVSGMELPDGHPPIGENGQAGSESAVPTPNVPRATPDQYGSVGPIRWEAPANWTARPPANEMRFAEYYVSGPSGVEPAELTVFYFGPGGGGGVEDNLDRWASQLQNGPDAVFGEEEINGVKIHTLDASGDYDAGMAMGGGEPKESQRLLGAIAETSQGLFFFRMLGPKQVVDGEEGAFQQFLQSFQHADG